MAGEIQAMLKDMNSEIKHTHKREVSGGEAGHGVKQLRVLEVVRHTQALGRWGTGMKAINVGKPTQNRVTQCYY